MFFGKLKMNQEKYIKRSDINKSQFHVKDKWKKRGQINAGVKKKFLYY